MKSILNRGARAAMMSSYAIAAAFVAQSCSSDAETKAAYEARSQETVDAVDGMGDEAKRIGDELRDDAVEFSEEIQKQAAEARSNIEQSVQQASDAIDDTNADEALEALKRELGDG